jgi:GNAT superfamily N-acetyltransferase
VSVHVWRATPDEAETVGGLLVAFRALYGREWPSDNAIIAGVERLIERPDTEYLLASPDADSPPAGVCQLRYRFSVWYAADDCWLEDLFVLEPARRVGVGRALVEAAVARARERGCGRVELDVSDENPTAWALYESLGFSADYKPPGRNVLMGLPLKGP